MAENEEKKESTEETPTGEGSEGAGAPSDAPEREEAEKVAYEVKETSDQEGSVKRYVVEVEKAVLDTKLQEVLEELRKNVTIEGFRRGKAPLGLLKIRFGKDAQDDALKDLAVNIGAQIVEAEELDAVAEPNLEDSQVEADKPVSLTIDIEVRPQIEVKEHTGRDYEVKVRPVSDELVQEQLDRIREANVTFEEPEDGRAWQPGDAATLDMEVIDAEGERMESLCRENVFMRDPESNLLPEVAEALKGKKGGDSFETVVERTVKNREGEDVTHKDTYKVTVRDIKVAVLPELDDEFAKDMGDFETLDALRDRIRKDLEEQETRSKRQQAMDAILTHLMAANSFDAPKTLVASQEYQTIMRDTQQMRQMGVDLSAMGMTTEGYLKNARANSERFVKTSLLVNAIAEQEKIEVGDEDVEKEIERRAEAEGRKPLAIRARLEADRQIDGLKRQLLVDKVEDFLMENNTIKETEAKEDDAEESEE